MTISVESGVLLSGLGIVTTMVASHVRLEGRINALMARFSAVEKLVGLNGSRAAFVRTEQLAAELEGCEQRERT